MILLFGLAFGLSLTEFRAKKSVMSMVEAGLSNQIFDNVNICKFSEIAVYR